MKNEADLQTKSDSAGVREKRLMKKFHDESDFEETDLIKDIYNESQEK